MLSLTYSQAVEEYPATGISTARKAITIRNTESVESISNGSDIIVYYDLVSDSTPLLLVERINVTEIDLDDLHQQARQLDDALEGYVVQVVDCDNPDYYDVVVVKRNIYASVMGGA